MLFETNTFDIGFKKYSLSYAFVQVSCTLKMDLKFSGPHMLVKTNTFDTDLKFSGFLDVDLKGKSGHLLCKSALSG